MQSKDKWLKKSIIGEKTEILWDNMGCIFNYSRKLLMIISLLTIISAYLKNSHFLRLARSDV